MINKKIKESVLKESDLDIALEILRPYENEKWGNKIISHLQEITPREEEYSISDFSYQRKSTEM